MTFLTKLFTLLIACGILAFALAGCAVQGNGPQENLPETDALESLVLTPESAAELYLENESVWAVSLEYASANYGYCLLDLDFDGIPELISSVMGGSGRYSQNRYYRIDPSDGTVKELPAREPKAGGYDLYVLSDEYPKLLRNESSGERFYYCADCERVSGTEYGMFYGKLVFRDGVVQVEELFYEYISEAEAKQHGVARDGKYEQVSKEEYESATEQFFQENRNLNLKWQPIDGEEYRGWSADEKKAALVEACVGGSYGGQSKMQEQGI